MNLKEFLENPEELNEGFKRMLAGDKLKAAVDSLERENIEIRLSCPGEDLPEWKYLDSVEQHIAKSILSKYRAKAEKVVSEFEKLKEDNLPDSEINKGTVKKIMKDFNKLLKEKDAILKDIKKRTKSAERRGRKREIEIRNKKFYDNYTPDTSKKIVGVEKNPTDWKEKVEAKLKRKKA
jgi:hypothetical protein